MSRAARQGMTDRQLLESLHERLDGIDDRLREGDGRFASLESHLQRVDADWTIAMNFLHAVSLERSRPDLAGQIEATIAERRPANGSTHPDLSDEPTNPGG